MMGASTEQSVKKHRQTWLPASGDELIATAWGSRQLRQIANDPQADPLLSLACEIIRACAPDEAVLVHTLASLRAGDVTRDSLAIPSFAATAFDRHRARYRLRLPKFARTALWRWRRRRTVDAEGWLVALEAHSGEQRLEEIRSNLRAAYAAWAQEAAQQRGRGSVAQWRMLFQAARTALLERGLPSLWLMPLSQLPLPVSAATPLWRAKDGETLGALGRVGTTLVRGAGRKARASHPPVPVADDMPEVGERNPLLVDAVRRTLREFRKQFFDDAHWQDYGIKSRSVVHMEQIVESHVARLQAIESSATSLAIVSVLWAHALALGAKLRASTIKSYSEVVAARRHLGSLYTTDVTDWDGDTVDDMVDEMLSLNPSAATIKRAGTVWSQCLRWLYQHDWLEEPLSLHAHADRQGVSLHRTQIVRPANLDEALAPCLRCAERDPSAIDPQTDSAGPRVKALVAALGLYGGLRAGEIEQLTLADVLIEPASPGEDLATLIEDPGTDVSANAPLTPRTAHVHLIVRRGKTPAARRRLPLHVLWPAQYTEALMAHLAQRTQALSRRRPRRQALFGPPGDERHYHRSSLIAPTIEYLRMHLGAGVDLHALRHAAATHWVLRVHGAQFDGFAAELNDRDHWLFQPDSMREFLHTLCAPAVRRVLAQGLEYQALARLIGHSSIETTTRTYAHSVGMVHSQWLERVFSNHWRGRKK